MVARVDFDENMLLGNVDATIMLVDDDQSILEAVADLLQLRGYRVITAQDGKQALERMDGVALDLIISDITMPGIDGYQFYEAVRRNPMWTSVPFIFLTARGQKTDVFRGYNLGADDYVVKPFEPDELLAKINGRLIRSRDLKQVAEVEADKMKQQLVTVFSHELRTPLTYIYGYSTLLREDLKSLDEETVEQMLDGVRWGAERMVRLVEDLMLLVRLDANLVVMEIERRAASISVSQSLNNALKSVSENAKTREIEIKVNCPDGLSVRALSAYLESVIIRVVENAVRFSNPGGSVEIDVEAAENIVCILVSDHGMGIDTGYQEKVFDRFFQVNRQQMEQQGTGMGLAIARELVRHHGGDITLKSEIDKGSEFRITWPMA